MSGVYTGTASAIARRVATERKRFDWLHLPREARDEPPATKAEMATCLRIRRSYEDDTVTTCTSRVVGADKLPAPADFAMMVTTEREAKEAVDRVAGLRMHPAYGPIIALTADKRATLARILRDINERRRRLLLLGYDWLHGGLTEALGGPIWRKLRKSLEHQLWRLFRRTFR